MSTVLEQKRKADEQLARDIHREQMEAAALDARSSAESLRKQLKRYDAELKLSTELDTLTAKMDPAITGVIRAAKQGITEHLSCYAMHWRVCKRDATAQLVEAEAKLKSLERELSEMTGK